MTLYVAAQSIEWSQIFRDLSGHRGLLAAIVGQAYVDLCQGCLDAAGYFMSPAYRHHLELLDLPSNWLPIGVWFERDGVLQVVAIEDQIMELKNESTGENETSPVLPGH